MALASLFQQLISERILPEVAVRPLIVNHKIRPESENEAYTVANRLEDLGMCHCHCHHLEHPIQVLISVL